MNGNNKIKPIKFRSWMKKIFVLRFQKMVATRTQSHKSVPRLRDHGVRKQSVDMWVLIKQL